LQKRRIRIAVDAAGGDHSPADSVKGALKAAQRGGVEVILVGPPDQIALEIHRCGGLPEYVTVVQSRAAIREGESATNALRRKALSSVSMAAKLVRDGKADAMVSAGSTGATSVSAMHFVGLIPGIGRPVVCVPLVGLAPETILVDGGANVDCKPHHMLSFAAIGDVYARRVLHIDKPKVALLSTGTEQGKGPRALKDTYTLLERSGLNFVGNVEGFDVLTGKANVIVCDGLVGNVLLKFYESLGPCFTRWVTGRLKGRPLMGPGRRVLCQMSTFTRLTRAESAGGGMLWGVNGVVQIMHGNSKARHFERAIARARQAVEANVIAELKDELATVLERCQTSLESARAESKGTQTLFAPSL
jgi:glycerol-3-phosphate acyltransferase PlsX